MRALIIDDEYLARQRLIKLLENEGDVIVVGQARNGKEALTLIEAKKPDLIFLDVKMPVMNGLEMLNKLERDPYVVFTTAYDKYALEAFDAEAIDYLLKPFDEERLTVALDRVRRQVDQKKSADFAKKLNRFMKTIEAESSEFLEKLVLKERGREITVLLDDVMWIEADGNYLRLISPEGVWLHRISMNEIEEQLDPDRFLRIHRSFLINVNALEGLQYRGNNEYKVKFPNGKELTSGRAYKPRIDDYLNGN